MKRLISLLLLICMTQFYIVGFSIENEPLLITKQDKILKSELKKENYIYTDTIPLGFIQPQESISVLTLVPFGVKAQMKLTVLDENTKQTKVINF